MAKNHWHSGKSTGIRAEAYKYGYKSGLELTVSNTIIDSEYALNYETETVHYVASTAWACACLNWAIWSKPDSMCGTQPWRPCVSYTS